MKLNLFGHICRREDSRLVKEVVFGEMEGKIKRVIRPNREWLDDVKEWCNEKIILKKKAQDRVAWKMIIKCALHWTRTGDESIDRWMDGLMDLIINLCN